MILRHPSQGAWSPVHAVHHTVPCAQCVACGPHVSSSYLEGGCAQGSYTNIKVTTPDDMSVAERFLSEHKASLLAAAA